MLDMSNYRGMEGDRPVIVTVQVSNGVVIGTDIECRVSTQDDSALGKFFQSLYGAFD